MMSDQDTQLILTIIGLVALVDAAIIIGFYRRFQQYRQLADPQHALHSKAEVHAIHEDTRGKTTRYTIDYRFKDWQGNQMTETHMLPHHIWQTVQVGQHVAITYLRNKPTISTLTDHIESSIQRQKLTLTALASSMVMLPIVAVVMVLTQLM